MPTDMKKYLIAYAFDNGRNMGVGNYYMEADHSPLSSESTLRDFERTIAKKEVLRNAVIINVLPIGESEAES